MERAIHISSDRAEVNSLPNDIQRTILAHGLITTGGKRVCFCGLIQSDTHSYVFLPRKMPKEKELVPNLFSSIRQYSKHSENIYHPDDEGDNFRGKNELQLVTSILSDFHTNGIYTRRNRLKKKNTGKPNWSRTMKNFNPFFSSNGAIYFDYSGSMTTNQSDSEVSRIHAYIVKTLDNTYGKILFGFQSYRDDSLLAPKKIDKRYLITVLKSEMHSLYSDRDIRLLKFLINYIETIYGRTKSEVVIGIKNFHSMWEYMLKQTISGTVDINKEFSIPTYVHINGQHLRAAQKGQRTDIIVYDEANNTYIIIDAKYYDAIDLQSSPGWGDLLKQFFYAKALKAIRTDAKVYNYFIFPGDKKILSSVYMQKHNSTESDDLYGQIQCLYVSPNSVMKAYTEGNILIDLCNKMVA